MQKNDIKSDYELVLEITRGNHSAFRLLAEKYQGMVFRTCMGFVHNREDAEDLTQEVLINAFEALRSFKGESAFSTWLYRIAVNASLNFVRNTQKKAGLIQRIGSFFGAEYETAALKNIAEDKNAESAMIEFEQQQRVHKALAMLPEKQRVAFTLSSYDDLPQREVAQIMNISEGAVESLLQRAKNNLQKFLNPPEKNFKPPVGIFLFLFLTF